MNLTVDKNSPNIETKWGIKTMWFDNQPMWLFQGDAKFHLMPILFDTKQQANDHCKHLELSWVEPYPTNEGEK